MSGIAVIFRRDGAPVPHADLEAMTSAMAHRAADGVSHEVDGPVAVGICSMAMTPEGRAPQPVRCRGASTIVAVDGRLDDRATLLARLGRRPSPDASDAELVGHAVDRFGAGFVNHLLGDFAVVVADVPHRRLVLARDHLGVRPLYYASAGPLFVAASEVRGVLAHPAVSDDLDPESVEAWTEHWVVPERTIYRSIEPLPMASVLLASANGIAGPSRYWTPSCAPDRCPATGDLVDEYRALVEEAVRDRLRATGPVVVAMSGGLDSTSVAATAARLARCEPAPDVRAASLVYPGNPRADESRLVDSMEAALGLPVRRVRPRPRAPADLAAEIERYRELPDVPNDQLAHLVRPDLGERVVLTGLGGDDWFYASDGLDVTRLVRHGRLAAAVRAARAGMADGRHGSVAGALWRHGVRPLPKVAGPLITRSPVLSSAVVGVGGALGARFLQASWCPAGVPLDTAPVLSWSRNPLLGARLASIERRAAQGGFEYRHPLHDVRLVELSLRIPGHLRIQGGDGRWVPRRAMEGVLPDDVRLRRAKAEFSVAVREELDLAAATGLLQRALSGAAALDDDRAAWGAIRTTEPDAWHPRLARLWSLVALELAHDIAAARSPAGPAGLLQS